MSDQDQELGDVDTARDEVPSRPVVSEHPGTVKFEHSDTDFGENGERWSTGPGKEKNHSRLPSGTEPTDGTAEQEYSHNIDKVSGHSDRANHTSLHRESGRNRREFERVDGLDPRLGPQNGISRTTIEDAMSQIPSNQNPLHYLEDHGWTVREMQNIYYASEGGYIWMTALRALIEQYEKRVGTDNIAGPHEDDEGIREYKIEKLMAMVPRNQTPAQFLESRGWKVFRRQGNARVFASDDDGSTWKTVQTALVAEYDKMQRRKVLEDRDY